MRNLLIALMVVVALILGVGFYRGWFKVDKDQIESDKNAVASKFGKSKTAEKSGTVTKIEEAEHRFTLTTKGGSNLLVQLTDSSKIWRNKKAETLGNLKDDDEVTVKYLEKDGKNEATSVTVGDK